MTSIYHVKGRIQMRVFGNSMIRRLFRLKRDEVVGALRKLHDELHNLNSSQNVMRMIK
jgi:hypothetical protein